ncbi:hypothetical protein [Cupriavidus sp. IDO]|uniref:hypothetical protein n=1 Tax=Cupriavidus sp. IDO TaxID=1539142 RepID=UPI000AF146A7|nr:hypothetical protein [Cupriavidus sp. IDO]
MENSADSQIRRCACLDSARVADGSQSMSVACVVPRNVLAAPGQPVEREAEDAGHDRI